MKPVSSYLLKVGADRRGKKAGKEFRTWVVKDLDPLSQTVSTVKKRRRNIDCAFVFSRFGDVSASENLQCAPSHRLPTGQTGFEGTVCGGPFSERIDQGAGEVPSEIEKTIVSPRSTADSEPEKLYLKKPDWKPLYLKTGDTAIPESAK
ncbi:hypothetical protein TNCV_1555561 [Trichonephila clavipes]|nr:hypothetical protein TNCV_1555561 [Trichonephila clavipes]